VEYKYSFSAGLTLTDLDFFAYGLRADSSLVAPDITDPAVIDVHYYNYYVVGTITARNSVHDRDVTDFTAMPSGGLIVAPTSLYAYLVNGLTGITVTLSVRVWFTLVDLSTEDYWQLVESRRKITG
jgi:hypothetical protein